MKNVPSTLRDYYKSMKNAIINKKDDNTKRIIDSKEVLNSLYKDVNANTEVYKDLGINLTDYSEYKNKDYKDGSILRKVKTVYNKNNTNFAIATLLSYAELQKKLHNLEEENRKYDRMLDLSFTTYSDIVRAFYTKVHEYMVVKGYGYVFEQPLGWLCINRCKVDNLKRKRIDYAATKKRKAELIAKGIRVYNKEEAEWCARNGIEYKAEDGRVYQENLEYVYEILLLNCTLENGSKYAFQSTDYRHSKLRGKTNDELSEECNNDIREICKLPLDLRTKLNMSVKADSTLYLNFIRNENQKPLADSKVNRKNRQ